MSHGYASVRVKGHAEKRASYWRRTLRRRDVPTNTGLVNVAGWERLASMWTGPLQRGGERLVN